MQLPQPVNSEESPREIILADFNIDLPIRGGWGYSQHDACIIDRHDPTVNPSMPFRGVRVEYAFVEKRIYEEMIVFRPKGDQFSGIRWKLLRQELIHEGDEVFDKLTFDVTAFPEKDWEELKAEWNGPEGHRSAGFDLAAHEQKSNERMICLTREFWFEISSFHSLTSRDDVH